ncbi:MAG: hypothetical protein R6W82_00210 [bacterium]
MAVVSPYRRPVYGRADSSFVCRYVERTLGQLGEEALGLPLVARHLSTCPACRAQRRRVARLDRALKDSLTAETPPFYPGRWEEIRDRLGIPAPEDPDGPGGPGIAAPLPRGRRGPRLAFALAALLVMLGGAWLLDHPPPSAPPAPEVAPGVRVTGAEVQGHEAVVTVEPEPGEDGTVYMWIEPAEPDVIIGPEQ